MTLALCFALTNRLSPPGRNQDYLKTVLDLNDGLLTLGGITSGSPVVLRPILGTVLGIPMTLRINRIKQWLVPLWKERLRLQDEADAGRLASTELPVDHVQMMTRYARRERPHEVDDYELIARRICAQSFGAVHQTSLQVCNLLLDILGSDSQHDTIARLCAEADAILSDSDLAPATEPIGKDVQEGEEEEEKKTPNGADPEKEKLKDKDAPTTARWTKARVSRMVLADSASRETLRLHSFANRACMRKCMVDGLQTPGGHNIPRGSVVSFLTHPVQTDADYYKDPLAYDPFRFARSRKENGGSGSSTPTTATSSSSTPMTFVSTGPEFLPFGHGRHACPGRFIVDFELKMITSHILRNYDIKFPDEYQGRRPPNVWIAEATFPPPGARILVKRKKKADAKV
jgi:cytochrome P450